MEFDVSKVYTAVNADELPIGSKCYFADDLGALKTQVINDDATDTLTTVYDEDTVFRFGGRSYTWTLAYLVELPKEKVVKPFETIEEAREVITAHGGFLKSKDDSVYFVTAYTACYDSDEKPSVCIINSWYSLEDLAKIFVFADDGSPCGKPVEE